MNVAVSPMASEASSPMTTSVTPTLEPSPDKHDDPCGPSVSGDGPTQKQDPYRRYQKPPPLHTGADWKVVLHLPEIETWLRTTTERVRDLTHSVQQDSINRHVDVHLVQLKDICEDISDHVEQIHALLETEFSLKLLSYSVNIIVDIRSVQLLWHQLRVSVLVLKERLLQGLQDSNGNYTRQTDILQAFSQDHDETRLDALTEVDDSGQLTIKCSKDYFSLDCGITAYELSDYSPIDDPEGRGPRSLYPELEQDFPELLQSVDLLNIAASRQNQVSSPPAEESVTPTQEPQETISGPTKEESAPDSAMQGDSGFGLSKRPLQGGFKSDVSPTQPLPKKPMYLKGDGDTRCTRSSPLQYQADLSRSTPSLLDTPDRSKFWLELESVYPGNGSQSYESLHAVNGGILQMSLKRPSVSTEVPLERRSAEAVQGFHTQKHLTNFKTMHSKAKQAYSDTSSPPPSSGEDISDPDQREMSSSPDDQAPTTGSLWIVNQNALCISNASVSSKEHWYGSDEFLALPAQLKKTEMLALKLESLAQALPQRGLQESIQDVDDWELTEVNADWESSSDLLLLHPYKKPSRAGRFSPTSSSDVAPSLDDSIESGPLSDLLSEDEGARSTPESRGRNISAGRPNAPKMMFQCTPLIQQLLADIQHQENYHDVWAKIEGFVSKLDEFICWLRDALETTDNWTPPRADIDSLKLYLETHLSFKLNVDSHSALKDSLLEEGRQLLELITSHKSGLRDMLHMISHQWQELQRQIRRQHNWMLRTLDAIKTHILSSERDEEERETHSHHGSPKVEVQQSHREAQKDVLDQMRVKLESQQYCSNSRSVDFTLMSKSNSLSEFEAEYQELWDWLMDMESIVTDSHDLMMSEEQQHHLYKGNSVEMSMWLPKKMQLLGWSESLKRSGTELPADFDQRLAALRSKWDQLEKILAEHVEPCVGQRSQRELLSPDTNRMVTQLESRIKELKSWLRDTELFIFNLNLRPDAQQCESGTQVADDPQHDPQATKQLQHFKALCMEVRGRRKGISSVLRLCQRLLDGPEQQSSEAERQSLQLLQVNLERRWEAIVMQVLQWQTRLKRSLGRDQVPENLIEPSLMDLHGQTEDSWEWDEMDMTICDLDTQDCEDEQNPGSKSHLNSPKEPLSLTESCLNDTRCGAALSSAELNASSSRVYQVYSLPYVELYQQPQYNHKSFSIKSQQSLLKRQSMDSSFSSAESLPDILGDLLKGKQGLLSDSARRSESESGIVSEGDMETTGNSEVCLLFQNDDPKDCVTLTLPTREDSLNGDRVSDEDIDRVLERANKCAEYGDSLTIGQRDQRWHIMRKKKEDSGESKRKHHKEPAKIHANDFGLSQEANDKYLNMSGDEERVTTHRKLEKELAQLSQGSSLDSLFAVGELFPSSKEALTRSTSLESWLAPCKSAEDVGSKESLRDIESTVESTGELSKRTLELLKRLENIQSPLAMKMTRSVSDVMLQSSSLWHGSRSAGAPSSINESSAASLTELSSTEDSSVASEDLAVQMNCCVAAESNASFRKQTDETDASISMVVNVSCTSACTDDEDDSDLLSSSTLTLTEEELGIKDDDDSSVTSEEEYIEGSLALGLDYIKGEFQSWMKPRSQNKEKNEADLVDELQCGTMSKEILSPVKTANDRNLLSRSALKLLEANTNGKNKSLKQREVDGNRRDATRSYISHFVDDMENGNVESTHIEGKDEDDELLREEGSLLTKKGESFKNCYVADGVKSDMVAATSPSSCEQLSLSSLEGQLKGELPCHNSHCPSPSISLIDECSGLAAHTHSRQKQLAAFLNDVHENHQESSSDSCSHPAFISEEAKSDSVHDFVMEIIDMTSVALKTKEAQAEQPTEVCSPTSVSQIREKVLEHSHRIIHLRKGDFYSYLSLSSHDSDCGEVSTCAEEDKSSSPILSSTPDLRDEEPLFEACTEEVYLGPPLCYSMSISKRPTRHAAKLIEPASLPSSAPSSGCDEYQKAHGISHGSVAGSQPECHNEAPYLNPLPCETPIDTVECFADTKMLESNISPVMTKIRVSCSTTNPLKEDGSLYINPKINCPLIRKTDSDERALASQLMKQKNVGKGHRSLQEAKSTHKQLARSESSGGVAEGCRAQISGPQTDSSSAGRSRVSSRPQVKRFSGSLATPVCKR
ncbi:A-kinase anchor protein 6 isoform X2 [Sinocyclocheilus rhinocerous]|uniref:A-kinase anchor protein 6 isoform X2 n=1 Tax=Sinocyclocheilus rhinocerous TaxID=307959 RepID=UPI0007B94CBA|nr:PREDICTED: A-kinase anchor protein 6-like isoform X2 [Sinocyclocheilus rhinocerous]